jgi:hypothetical protein
MTTFPQLMKSMLKKRINFVHKAFGVYLLIALITCAYQTVVHDLPFKAWPLFTVSYAMGLGVVAFILIALMQERVWTSPRYRLLPITETKLYLANVLSNFLSSLYLVILSLIPVFLMNPANFIYVLQDGTKYSNSGEIAVTAFILLALPAYTWCFISMIHLLTNAISDFLPVNGQRVFRVILVIAILYFIAKTSELIGSFINFSHINVSAFDATLYATPIWFLLIWAIISIINIYLLKNWVQAAPKTA